MLTEINLVFGCFINLFLVPVVGLKIYCNRHDIPFALPSAKIPWLYILMTILNYPLSRVMVIVIQKLVPVAMYVEESKYTLVALCSCIVLSFVMEIFEKILHIDVFITMRDFQKTSKDKSMQERDGNEK